MALISPDRPTRTYEDPPPEPAPSGWATASLFVLATWLLSPLALLLQSRSGLDREVLMLVQFAPGLAALVVAVLRRRREPAVRALLARSVRLDRGTATRSAVGLALVAVVVATTWAVLSLADRSARAGSLPVLGHPLALILVTQFLGAAGEELGWRSLLLPYLSRRYGANITICVIGILWASWHVQYYGFGPIYMAAFTGMCIAITSIMVSSQRGRTRGSLYVTTSIHWALNIGILLLLPIGGGHVMTVVGLAVAAAVVAVLVRRFMPVATPSAG